MGGIAGPELVAAVSLAGGFGVFGSALDGTLINRQNVQPC